jgi:CubicO group peptidase (beta-lactamase class C family)
MGEQDPRRAAAVKRLQEKREFWTHVITFVVVNGAVVGIWAVSGAGYFWPIWLMLAWGIGLTLHAWTLWGQKPITEERIEQEMLRQEAAGLPVEAFTDESAERE